MNIYPKALEVRTRWGSLPLHFACKYNQSESVIQLLITTYPEVLGKCEMPATRALHNKKPHYQVKPTRMRNSAHSPLVPNTKSHRPSTKSTARANKFTGGQYANKNAKEYWND